jgi:hypothetical protein
MFLAVHGFVLAVGKWNAGCMGTGGDCLNRDDKDDDFSLVYNQLYVAGTVQPRRLHEEGKYTPTLQHRRRFDGCAILCRNRFLKL